MAKKVKEAEIHVLKKRYVNRGRSEYVFFAMQGSISPGITDDPNCQANDFSFFFLTRRLHSVFVKH